MFRLSPLRLLAALVAVLVLVGPGVEAIGRLRNGGTALPRGETASEVRKVVVDGKTRTYRIAVPPMIEEPAPVVLSFHGYGSSAAGQEDLSGFSDLAQQERFIAVYPEGEDRRWRALGSSDADIRFVDAILSDLMVQKLADPRRIFATGISNGAQMAYALACARPDRFAGFAFVAGSYGKACTPGKPAILFHGTEDKLLPYGGRGPQMAVRSFARSYASRPGCAAPAKGEVLAQRGDATAERWACDAAASVVLWTLAGKGHSWPGSGMPAAITSRDVDASAAIWDFFSTLTR